MRRSDTTAIPGDPGSPHRPSFWERWGAEKRELRAEVQRLRAAEKFWSETALLDAAEVTRLRAELDGEKRSVENWMREVERLSTKQRHAADETKHLVEDNARLRRALWQAKDHLHDPGPDLDRICRSETCKQASRIIDQALSVSGPTLEVEA
jgi:chromosome segregation ATPase